MRRGRAAYLVALAAQEEVKHPVHAVHVRLGLVDELHAIGPQPEGCARKQREVWSIMDGYTGRNWLNWLGVSALPCPFPTLALCNLSTPASRSTEEITTSRASSSCSSQQHMNGEEFQTHDLDYRREHAAHTLHCSSRTARTASFCSDVEHILNRSDCLNAFGMIFGNSLGAFCYT